MILRNCNAPDVKVQKAEESKLSKSAEDRDEADDDEDVQSSCISHLMSIMKWHRLKYDDADLKAVAMMTIKHHLWFGFATKSDGDNSQSAGSSESSPGSCLMTHVGLDQPERYLKR